MPENWDPGEQVQDKVVIPIIKALPLIKSLVYGGQILTNNGISFFKQGSYYRIIVPGSRAKGGDVYLDKEILELVDRHNFDKVSDKMAAMLPEANITQLVEILQKNHSCSVTVNSGQFRQIDKSGHRYNSRRAIELPPPNFDRDFKIPSNHQVISLLELEAEALALELELLAAKKNKSHVYTG